ncbi:MAG TPA: sugar ABC transporter permease [Gaiellaceae bacterium]|nr:sugar ABC transporter permease [Gaiellaceae bacterium]
MRRARRWLPGLLLLLPSIVLIAVFVYGLIGWNVKVSFSDWRQAQESTGFDTSAYAELFPPGTDPAWTEAVKHVLLFTAAFMVGSIVLGALLALLLEKGVRGEGFFRAVYLFPMAVSFIAAGVVWRWLMNPASGDRGTGLNLLFDKLGLGFLSSEWYLNPSWGAASLAMPAIWALTGYIMALYLAGFRGVPEELREAARMDGASEWRVYRHVVFPHLTPVTLSALIILGHISIKVFDLIVAIGGKQFITQTPAVYMWILIFDARDYAKGAAIATLLLVGISVLIVPYLIYTARAEKRA